MSQYQRFQNLNAHQRAHRSSGLSSKVRERRALLSHDRVDIFASLRAASDALHADPDAAALILDGALGNLLEQWAGAAHVPCGDRRAALEALDVAAPAIAVRLRLALQAHDPEARLAHCRALFDLLTRSPVIHSRSAHVGDQHGESSPQFIHQRSRLHYARKDG